MTALDRLSAYDYDLPPELIAQEPLADRSAGRLLVVDRRSGALSHRQVRDLPELLQPGDCLVLNDSRVVPARLQGFRTQTGGRWEGLFLGATADGRWRVIGQTRGHLRVGESVTIPAPPDATITLILKLTGRDDGGVWLMQPDDDGEPFALLDQFGTVPLPPYIRHGQEAAGDRERYQTVYAATPGSVAAPTAGLHFTSELLAACAARGIHTARVTLHVGLGTFRPVNVENLRNHAMHAESCAVSAETMATLQQTRSRGGRIVSVGTTSLRTLETAVGAIGWTGWQGESRLFVYPPYEFQAVDGLLTNFHLPKSTLLMLVSAFAGYELTRAAYRAAIAERYRFFSYGDAMLIV
ncbi:MAG TPA: tRNA preQ1(34) S-adenosylmethionine ribosyltransferase-isomerase QueA [Planctomycetaceae bacterium]|nr:tRNA preQ1(34) S-adenosylmethionine ribosyltransferase-isomerase QueA [Planctomycetaceae bacterium]